MKKGKGKPKAKINAEDLEKGGNDENKAKGRKR